MLGQDILAHSAHLRSDWSFLTTENTVYIIFPPSNDVSSLFVINNDIFLQFVIFEIFSKFETDLARFLAFLAYLYRKFMFCPFLLRWLAFSYLLLFIITT